MTDRLKGFVVTLETDVREDDAQEVISAIGLLKGVLRVDPVDAAGVHDQILRTRIRHEYYEALRKILINNKEQL